MKGVEMNKYEKVAELVLQQVGGTENIIKVYHCMTRLRFQLKDDGKADLEQLKAINGVMGAQFREDTLQVIIGTTVDDVYQEILKQGGLTGESHAKTQNMTEKDSGNKKFSLRGIGNGIIHTFSNSMGPLVPLFVTLGMVNIVAALIGPSVFHLVSDTSDIYNNFYYIGQAIIYFLPILVAVTASKHFGANMYIAVTLAALMVYPELTAAIGGETGFTIYGIHAPNAAYDSQIIPILLVVWAQSYIEKGLNKVIPDAMKIIGVGFFTVLIMFPLEFLVLGPLGNSIGSALVSVVLGLYQAAGPAETTIVCALISFLTAFGIGRPIFFACMSVLLSNGVEYAYMPIAMVLNNFLIMGISLGYFIKEKSTAKKQLGMTCFISTLVGGVSEPALFGIVLPNKKTFLPIILSGALSGLYLGITHVGYYQFGPSNILSVLGFVSTEGGANFINGCIASGIALTAALLLMLLLYKNDESGKESQG